MKKFWFQSFIITVFVFFMLWGANKATDLKIFTAFDSMGQALRDFELTDYALSNLREQFKEDERIILVNIGNLPRREVARQIMIINSFHPRLIAFDGFFNCEGGLRDSVNCPQLLDTLGNLMLANAIQNAPKFILATKLLQTDSLARYDSNESDSLEYSDPIFNDYAEHGFVTLPTDANYQEDVKQCRTVYPRRLINGKEELAFSVRIAMEYDSVKTKRFLARANDEELVNFKRNIEVRTLRLNSLKNDEVSTTNFGTQYYTVDVYDLQDEKVLPELFKDNIVMMGFMGDYLGDTSWDDKFFTPLNKTIGGRANPDMFGLVVHANIVSMILDEDPIDTIPEWLKYAIAFLVCIFTVALFIWIDQHLPMWFDALSVIIQLAEVLFISLFIIQAFSWWNLKLDLGVAIGISALVGPAYDIFKSLQNEINRRLTKRRERVSNR